MSGEKNMRTAETLSGRIMVYAEIYLTIQINAFLYYLNRLPVFGKIVHSSWHSRYRLKKYGVCSALHLALSGRRWQIISGP